MAPAAAYPIVPHPRSLRPRPGAFRLDERTRLLLAPPTDPAVRELATRWAEAMRQATGLPLPVVTGAAGPGAARAIVLALESGGASRDGEGYRLSVAPGEVRLSAPSPAGLFYGLQTLRQLLPPALEAGRRRPRGPVLALAVPAVEIEDAPRFPYRGMHLDVSRHFFPVSAVKRYLELLSLYKLNRFHWHLTDDQGWRLEVRRHPRLTGVGAYRRETVVGRNAVPYVGDGTPHGGFYTQEEVREVVAYARQRFIVVVPEIEMPGHSRAALAAYPELACTPGPFEVATSWGVFEDIYCPKEKTFRFLEEVLEEVLALFPGELVHLGGDEVPKERWRESPVAQAVMQREGLADEEELQGWFLRRMADFLRERGRRPVGWDETLEGGLPPEAVVMAWRGVGRGIEAARRGHDVVMTPTSHLYFDHYQGDPEQEPLAIGGYTPLEKVYRFEPVPPGLPAEAARHILGAQGNVWTEYLPSWDRVEYMLLPRMLALSEVVWSAPEARDWEGFLDRLPAQLERLDALGVRYRIPDVAGLERDRLVLGERATVALRAPVRGGEIRYTLDGSLPTRESAVYRRPLVLPVAEEGVTVSARVFLADGRAGHVRRARFVRTRPRPPVRLTAGEAAPGLLRAVYVGEFRAADELPVAGPAVVGRAEEVGLPAGVPEEGFALRFTGLLRVPEEGVYRLRLACDGACRVYLADQLVVEREESEGRWPPEGEGAVALAAGHHSLEVRYLHVAGAPTLRLEMGREDAEPRSLPREWLFHRLPTP